MIPRNKGILFRGDIMTKKKDRFCPRVDPEEQICPAYDSTGIKLFPIPAPESMGFRIVDNFPEEHIQ